MRKGITAVIAVILLLFITIAITGFAFVFFQRTVETTAKSGEQQLSQQIQQIGGQFVVDNVDKNRVYIRNTGTTTLSGFSFFAEGQNVPYSGPASLASNTLGTFTLDNRSVPIGLSPDVRVTASGGSDNTKLAFSQLTENGGFEDDSGTSYRYGDAIANNNIPDGWGCSGVGGSWGIIKTARSGVNAVNTSNPTGVWTACYQRSIPFQTGKSYKVSGWYLCPSGLQAQMFFGDDVTYGSNAVSSLFLCDGAWKPMNLTVALNSTAVSLSVYVYGMQSLSWAAYDDIFVTEVYPD